MSRIRYLTATAALAVAAVGLSSTAAAAPAEVSVEVNCANGTIDITSTKGLSNIVVDTGNDENERIEEPFEEVELLEYSIPLDGVETIWVKSGSNKSGDGPGYGERVDIPPCDADGDGFNADVDCDDTNPDIYPGAVDIPNNGIDEDCDGEDLIVTEGELRVTLTWNTDDDLDLYVTDPAGDRVSWFNTSVASGGTLDRDDNVGQCGVDPDPGGVENIIWPESSSPPTGTYTVELSNYDDCDNGGAVTASYTIQVFFAGVLLETVDGTTNSTGGGSTNIVDSFQFTVLP